MIRPGTLLAGPTTPLPECLQRDTAAADGSRWVAVRPTCAFPEWDRQLQAAGWTFFYIANAMAAVSAGFDREKAARTAIDKLIIKAEQLGCNCLQIDRISPHRFLGIPYVRMSGHVRHIQKGLIQPGWSFQAA